MKSLVPTGLLSFVLSIIPAAFAGGAVEPVHNNQKAMRLGHPPPVADDYSGTKAQGANFVCFTGFSTVVTGDATPPANAIQEINGQSIDTNKGMGGDYVYMVPNYVKNPGSQACATDIWFAFVPGQYHTDDLASGAGGVYRYINWQHFLWPGLHNVTQVAMYRTDSYTTTPPSGWQKMTTDINQDRHGDYLYVLFNLDG